MATTVVAQSALTASPCPISSSASPSLVPSSISRTGLRLKRPHSVTHLFFTHPPAPISSRSPKSSSEPFNLVMQWQDCKVKLEIDVPTLVAYKCYSDRESMPQWLPYVSSVKLTVSYEVPQILAPVESALTPFVQGLLLRGLESLSRFAKQGYSPSSN